jgi:two-component system response regulator (stage 0 sporulation protein A)
MNNIETRKLLGHLGVTSDLNGYIYLTDAIEIVKAAAKEGKSYIRQHGFCSLYDLIAEKYDTTPTTVERCIRYAVELAQRLENEKFKEVFPYVNYKVTSAKFVNIVAEYMLIEEEERL